MDDDSLSTSDDLKTPANALMTPTALIMIRMTSTVVMIGRVGQLHIEIHKKSRIIHIQSPFSRYRRHWDSNCQKVVPQA